MPLNLAPQAGDFWEFFWTSEQTTFAQPSTTTSSIDVGRFRIALDPSVLIEGQEAFPLVITGDTGELAPRWTHVAVGADGSLLGSTDGAGLATIYDAATDTWIGGGMFTDFADNPIDVTAGQFEGVYNEVPAIIAGRSDEQARCEEIADEVICDDEATEFSEREFYKEGVGPIGYAFRLAHSDDGGGFLTSTTIVETIELVESSLAATDGSVFVQPPWDEMAPLGTPREQHAALVFDGKIWVLGGVDQEGNALDSVEIYDPATNEWAAGPALPGGSDSFRPAVSIGDRIYVPVDVDGVLVYDPDAGAWSVLAPAGSPVELCDANSFDLFGLSEVVIGACNGASIGGYDPMTNQWVITSGLLDWFQLEGFTVEVVGDSLFVVGGFGQPTLLDLSEQRGAQDLIMEFDIGADSWVTPDPGRMNLARDNHASVVLDDKIYIFGGNPVSCVTGGACTPGNPFREAEVFDPASGESTELPSMFQPRQSFAAVALNGLIYVIGGSDGNDTLGSMDRLTP